MYNIISSGSKGNAIIYEGSILVDCGVSFSLIKPYVYDLQLVLLTHLHGDHFNWAALTKLSYDRPTLRFACGEHMVDRMDGIKNIDIMLPGEMYDYGEFQISPIKLYHDIPNFGYRIFKEGRKIIHVTDTAHLEGITAKDYDLYALEHNYNEDIVDEIIKRKKELGEFCHLEGAINSHLSEQQARDFYFNNKGEHSKIIRLHESSTNY